MSAATGTVLLLNLGGQYEAPLGRISWNRAAKLLAKGKAVLCLEPGVEMTFDEVTESKVLSFKSPGVIRLNHWVNPSRKGMRFSRWNVMQRDNMTCQYCGRSHTAANLTLDHVNPRCKGGKTTWDNIVACCRPCNQKKGGKTLAESKMVLRSTPKRPSANTFVRMSIGRDVPDTWRDFLYWNSELQP